VLYHLPQLLAADPAATVHILEGERDVDRAAALGLVATTCPQGAGKWAHTDRAVLTGRHVICIPDNDAVGREHMRAVACDLAGKAASIRILELEGLASGGDVSDWLDAGHTVEELAKLAAAAPLFVDDRPPWHGRLIRTATGQARDVLVNGVMILRHDPALASRVRWNALLCAVEGRDLPWQPGSGWRPWTDTDDLHLTAWVQERGVLLKRATVADAVQVVAHDHTVHPILDRLAALQWDGVPRLDTWPSTYLGATDGDGEDDAATRKERRQYLHQVGRKFLIAAVARLHQPGCQADSALILEGPQGAGKSSAAATLALDPAWFTDCVGELGTRDAAQDLRGKWVVELAELSALKRAEIERVKAFISRRVDHYRPPYGRRSEDFGRQCVFIGSTNAATYLADETGGRRFWPVQVGEIDLAALRRDVEQLWAEALVAYQAGECWWLDRATEAIAAAEQRARYIPDAWEPAILRHIIGRLHVTIPEVLEQAIKVRLDHQDQIACNRVARVLMSNGWERKRRRINGSRTWVYVRAPKPEPPSGDRGDGVGTEKPANMRDVPVSPVSPVGFPHRENGQTTNGPIDSFVHVKSVERPSPSGDSGDTRPSGTGANGTMASCWVCRSPVRIGEPGYAWTPEGHAHAVCVSPAEVETDPGEAFHH
jgi:hypothetical protein